MCTVPSFTVTIPLYCTKFGVKFTCHLGQAPADSNHGMAPILSTRFNSPLRKMICISLLYLLFANCPYCVGYIALSVFSCVCLYDRLNHLSYFQCQIHADDLRVQLNVDSEICCYTIRGYRPMRAMCRNQ